MPERTHSHVYQVLAEKYQPEVSLLERTGKLTLADGWNNVVDHSLVQAEALNIFSGWLRLPPSDQRKSEKVAIWHDWRKRLDIKPGDFSDDEKVHAARVLSIVNPDPNLMAATGPAFLEKVLAGQSTFLERLQFYVDDIAMGSEIVPLTDRIDEVEGRKPELNEDAQLTASLGGRRYWEAERLIGRVTEQSIADFLNSNGFQIEDAASLPLVLREELRRRGVYY